MKRTAIFTAWLASVLAAFWLGALLGAPDATERDRAGIGSDAGSTAPPQSRGVEPGRPQQEDDAGGVAAHPVDRARALADAGRPEAGIELLIAYLGAQGFDAQALFLLSDLRQMSGQVELALDPLLEVLRFPPDPESADRARRRLDLLINAREQQLINAGDLAGLVAYFERLVAAEPAYDGHRLKLARWLLRSGATEDAARMVREVGLVGVTPEQLEALEREVALASTALPVERAGGAMYTSATVTGARRSGELRLLIDTGATMSGIAEARLKALGARLVRDGVRVQTANGVTELPVYRIRSLELGALVLEDMQVLGFDDLPRGAEGLLGMDVLGKLSSNVPEPVGRL